MKTEKVNYKKRNSKPKCFFALLMAFSLVLQLPGVTSITMAVESTNGNSSPNTREGNKIPTITSNAEETEIVPNNKSGETVDPVFFVMGLPTTGTSSDGSKSADPIVKPLTLTGKDSDGTINEFFNYDGNLHELGASDLTFTKEPAVFPGDPKTSTGVLKIAGKFSHEPGGLYTRYLKVVDNGGEAFQYRYKIIGYTDSLINTNPIVKDSTDSISDAEIYSRLALEIKSSKFSTITDQFQNYFRNAFGDRYGVRTIVGYKKSNENNYNNETSVTSIVDKSGTYDVKVKTTNPWGQSVYNVVQIQFNAPPTIKMSEQFEPKSPTTKVPVADPANLTDTEKEAVKKAMEEANKDLNPKLPENTTFEVGKDGTVTVKYPDGTTDTIQGSNIVKKSVASEYNLILPNKKVIVKNPKDLTTEEKAAVREAVIKANPDSPGGITISVGDDGKVTVTYRDNSVDTIEGSEIVVQADSEKYKPVAPSTKVSVTEPTNLTNDEKEAVKKAIEDANKNLDPKLPEKTEITVGNDGTVTVKYPDGTTDTIPGTEVVKKSDAATNNPVAPDNKVPVSDPKALTPEEKKSVEEAIKKKNPTLPEKTEVSVGDDGTVTVKYPDGSTDTIPGTDVVKKSDAAAVTPVAPTTKVPVADPTNLTETEKEAVKKAIEDANKNLDPKLPDGTKLEVGNDGTVTVKYPDGTMDTIPGTDVVKKSLASETNVVVPSPKIIVKDPKNLTSDEKTAVSKKVLDANPNLPRNTTITVGDDGKVTITYNDNSVDTIEGSDIVVQAESEKYKPVAPSTKVSVTEPTNLTNDEKEAVKKAVEDANKNLDPKLPDGTKLEVGNDGTVTVKYPDGSTDTIPGTDVVKKSDAATNNPVAPDNKVPVSDPKALTPEEKKSVEEAIKKKNPTLPDNTEISVGDDGTVTVKYPDGSTDSIPGTYVVKKSDAATNNPVAPDNKVPVSDPKALTPEEKKSVEDAIKKKNPILPENTEVSVGDDGTVTVKYPDGSTDTIPGTDVVKKSDAATNNPVAPDNKVPVSDPKALTPEEKKSVEEAIKKKNPTLPENTEITVGNDGTVTVKYPDGTTDTIPGTDVVRKYYYNPSSSGSSSNSNTSNSDRLNGKDRVETAVKVSRASYPYGARAVILANKDKFPDVLTAVPFSVQIGAPILFTNTDSLPKETIDEIARLNPSMVYINGGEHSVSMSIEQLMKKQGRSVHRFNGVDRYDTARLIGEKIRERGNKKVVEIASGETFPDALSISSLAVKENAPILLSKRNDLTISTKSALASWDVEKVTIAGQTATISSSVESSVINGFNTGIANTDSIFSGTKNIRRIGGADRYETSALIAKYAVPESKLGVYTSGEVFADALVAGPYAGLKNAPVLLVSKNNVPSSIANYTKTSKIDRAVVVGGASTVYDSTFDMIKSLIKR